MGLIDWEPSGCAQGQSDSIRFHPRMIKSVRLKTCKCALLWLDLVGRDLTAGFTCN